MSGYAYVDPSIAGLQEVGDDDEEIERLVAAVSGLEEVGAVSPAAAAAARARLRPGSGSGPRLVGPFTKTAPEMGKRAPLGFGAYSLLTLTSTTLTARVQRAFTADRLLVTASATGILITSIKIGDEEQVLNGSVPQELYGTNAITDSRPDNFTATKGGIDLSITLSNPTAGTITGAVGMKGFVVR